MMILKNILICTMAFTGMVSCNTELEEEISWDLDEQPDMLVVEGTITNEQKRHIVFLSLTGPYFSTDAPRPVQGAEITVDDGDILYKFSENETNRGNYISDSSFAGETGKKYTLRIMLSTPVNGRAEYTAETVMPEGLTIDTIICEIYRMPEIILGIGDDEIDSTILSIYYEGKEPEHPDNYYLGRIFRNDVPWQATVGDYLRFTDDYNNGNSADYILFAKNVVAQDTIRFNISSVGKDYYDYIGSIQQMDQSGNAYNMSGPPANAIGNINNALGFFYACFISEKTGFAVDKRYPEY